MNGGIEENIIQWLMNTNTESLAVKIVLTLFFFAVCFIFAGCIGAIDATSVNEVRKKSEHGEEKAVKALKILDNEDRILKRCRCGMVISMIFGIFTGTICVFGLSDKCIYNLVSGSYYMPVSALVLFLTILIVIWLFYLFGVQTGEKSGRHKREDLLIKNAGLYIFASSIFAPFSWLTDILSDMITKISGKKTLNDQNQRTEEEILLMVDEGEEKGAIEENTKDMIENVFEFDDRCVDEVMTHRKDVVAVRSGSPVTEAAKKAMDSGKSRLPVYGEDIDDIVGILYVKDLLKYVYSDIQEKSVTGEIIKEAIFVPESKRCSEMFEYMTENKIQIAVVVDEFGGTGGIITMEDLIESIVGSIQDEYDNEDEEIQKVDDRSFSVSGSTSLDEISDLTGLDFEDEADDTIAGVMLDRMGHIPKSGEHPSVVINGTRFTVQEIENRRISKVLVVKPKPSENGDKK